MPSLVLLTAGIVLSQFYRSTMAVLAPYLAAELGATPADLGTMSGIWFFAFALAQLPIGVAIDRWGIARSVVLCLAIGVVGALLFADAASIADVLLAQVLLGIACSPLFIATLVFIAGVYPLERFTRISGTVLAVSNIGLLGSATPLAAVAERLGWRAAMIGMAAATLLLAVLVACFVRLRQATRPRETLGEAIRGIASVARLAALWPLVPFVTTCSAIVLTVRGLWGGPYLDQVFGLDAIARGNILAAMIVGLAVSNYVASAIEFRLGSPRPIIIVLSAATLATLAALASWPDGDLALVIAGLVEIGIFGAGYGLVMAHGRAFLPAGKEGRGMTFLNFFNFMGLAAAQFLTGLIIEAARGRGVADSAAYGWMFAALAVLLALASVAYVASRDPPIISPRP
ncbi:MAG: MFS transporter [Alphaproteobacteria bacterium]